MASTTSDCSARSPMATPIAIKLCWRANRPGPRGSSRCDGCERCKKCDRCQECKRCGVGTGANRSRPLRTPRTASTLRPLAPLAAAQRWSSPRTPWGDPDLQGVYANDNEYATPLERPREFDGKTLADVTANEMARVRSSALQQMVTALPGGRVRGPDEWWIQNLDLAKRSQPWLIVDPPDGHIPPLTAEAQKR